MIYYISISLQDLMKNTSTGITIVSDIRYTHCTHSFAIVTDKHFKDIKCLTTNIRSKNAHKNKSKLKKILCQQMYDISNLLKRSLIKSIYQGFE